MVDLLNSSKGEPSPQEEASSSQQHDSQTEISRRGSLQTEISRSRSSSIDSTLSHASSRSQRDALRHRIFHLSELLREEKANRDGNTSCYVELASKADREKASSIRQAFERINQRSSANIAHLEQRLQESLNQLKKLEQKTLTAHDSSISATSAQQLSFAHRGSLAQQTSLIPRDRTAEIATVEEIHLPPLIESKEEHPEAEAASKQSLEEISKQKLQELKVQLLKLREDHKTLENEWHKLEEAWKADKKQMMELLQEEKRRHYHLEVQVNDVIQINLSEITNLKHDLACTEEKMVYQSYERSRDIWEVLESYQTRLSKLESQQQAQQQEAIELPQASVYKLYGQLMNLLLTIATIVLVCISTISTFVLPFLHTRWRAVTTLLLIITITIVWKYLPVITKQKWTTWLPANW
ncbi:testis-specific protein TEX28 [Hemicordylus capensis]|uniref:testis-specific protein TEX28 n=1 Tax=Hemicordylus capensis TaxID=884348 RepID=UPI0023023E7D|nr:testis-specific protein TEX28 [Hemicordylus capensis]XP_053147188.1 testis-specific protein TEX28 [Hemicordylus capensis]XP_053147189.1 testis-specific protein TEX28 [Hemicordylus capensis]